MTALLIGPAFLGFIYVGGWALALILAIGGCRLFYEWDRMTRDGQFDLFVGVGLLAVSLAVVLTQTGMLKLAFGVILIAMVVNWLYRRRENLAGWNSVGIGYLGLGVASLLLLTQREQGAFLVLWLASTVFATDTGAYAAGRYFGGPKMAPTISPKKTWSGFVGGLVGASIWSLGISFFLGFSASPGVVLSSLIVSVIAQLGDLFESWLKRRFDVKDTGQILPGHGGLMDRVDSLITAVLVVAVLQITTDLFRPILA